jgi:hypothetical protein
MLLRQNCLVQTPFLSAERLFADLRGLIVQILDLLRRVHL